jgi:hypothetical protein
MKRSLRRTTATISQWPTKMYIQNILAILFLWCYEHKNCHCLNRVCNSQAKSGSSVKYIFVYWCIGYIMHCKCVYMFKKLITFMKLKKTFWGKKCHGKYLFSASRPVLVTVTWWYRTMRHMHCGYFLIDYESPSEFQAFPIHPPDLSDKYEYSRET